MNVECYLSDGNYDEGLQTDIDDNIFTINGDEPKEFGDDWAMQSFVDDEGVNEMFYVRVRATCTRHFTIGEFVDLGNQLSIGTNFVSCKLNPSRAAHLNF